MRDNRNAEGQPQQIQLQCRLNCFEFATTLPQGTTLPYDFGFIPSTLGKDGDAMDALVLMDCRLWPAISSKLRVVGAIQAEQLEKTNVWIRNDRLVAVAQRARVYEDIKQLVDLRHRVLAEITEFFIQYNKPNGRKFKPLGNCDSEQAVESVNAGCRKLENKR